MNKRFPLYRSHAEASCFNCGGDFGDAWPMRSSYPHGRGAFVQACERCRHNTYYDIGCRPADYQPDREGRCNGCGEYIADAIDHHND